VFHILIIRALNLPALRSPQGEGWVSDSCPPQAGEISISDFGGSSRRSTSVERPLQIRLFMKNKANFKIGKI